MNVSRNPFLTWLDRSVNECLKYKKQIAFGLVAALLASGLVVGYLFFKNNANTSAYKDFITALKHYDGVVMTSQERFNDPSVKYFTTEHDKWTQTENIFNQGYQKHSRTNLGCMFLAFRAESLLNLGKIDEATTLFNEAINKMPNNDIKDYYKVKVALIKMDKNDTQGIEELQKMADTENSIANDLALYKLGAHYWNQKKFKEAKEYWQRLLVKTGGSQTGHSSPFAQEIKEKLNLFSTENL
ncbi:MAG: hypothetical protein US49_C0008G0014 [candidate division TM6 bacterium GW2011_GWF2_37_49]|nr:MAG: hypothetical protein US49_C0008G0014 [candidate division TM6 bacterium GW2011_GWF2_37_49]